MGMYLELLIRVILLEHATNAADALLVLVLLVARGVNVVQGAAIVRVPVGCREVDGHRQTHLEHTSNMYSCDTCRFI